MVLIRADVIGGSPPLRGRVAGSIWNTTSVKLVHSQGETKIKRDSSYFFESSENVFGWGNMGNLGSFAGGDSRRVGSGAGAPLVASCQARDNGTCRRRGHVGI